MSNRFTNNLFLDVSDTSVNNIAGLVSRVLFEIWTQTGLSGVTNKDSSGNWATTISSGSGASTPATYTNRVVTTGFDWTGGSYQFNYITLNIPDVGGDEDEYSGVYRIMSIIDANTITVDTDHGVHEDGFPTAGLSSISWRHFGRTTSYFPSGTGDFAVVKHPYSTTGYMNTRFETSSSYDHTIMNLGPFDNWNATSHAWDDSKYTADKYMFDSRQTRDYAYLTLHTTEQRMTGMIYVQNSGGANRRVGFIYFGEITPRVAASDTSPSIILSGDMTNTSVSSTLGYGRSGASSIDDGARWLAYDDLTTITGYIVLEHIQDQMISGDTNYLSGTSRVYSDWNGDVYGTVPILKSITSTFQEERGRLIDVEVGPNRYPELTPTTASKTKLHLFGGILLSVWNGSDILDPPLMTP
jgi:hypothetical protein